MEAIRVGALLDDNRFDLRLSLVAGRQGLSRRISSSRIQKPGLVLAGFTEYLHKERVQVFGNTEMSYLATLAARPGASRCSGASSAQDVACLVVTKGLEVPAGDDAAAAEEAGVPILRTTPPLLDLHRERPELPRGRPHRADLDARRAPRRLRRRHPPPRQVGHRQERDRARPRHARPPARRRRHRGREAPLARRGAGGRLRDHQAPHGDPRPRHHQHQGPLRRRLDPRAEEDRDRARAGRVGSERRVRPARRGGEEVPDPRRRDPDAHRARCGPAAT